MSIASMTGFARETGITGPYQWAWEIKTVNGRGLEVRVRNPSGLDAVGEEARAAILKSLSRGQGQLNLTISKASAAPRLRVNTEALKSLMDAVAILDLPSTIAPASLDGLLSIRGVVELDEGTVEPAQDPELAPALKGAIAALIASLREARFREGQALAAVLLQQLVLVSSLRR